VTYTSVTTGRNNLLLAAASDSYEQSYSALQPNYTQCQTQAHVCDHECSMCGIYDALQ